MLSGGVRYHEHECNANHAQANNHYSLSSRRLPIRMMSIDSVDSVDSIDSIDLIHTITVFLRPSCSVYSIARPHFPIVLVAFCANDSIVLRICAHDSKVVA